MGALLAAGIATSQFAYATWDVDWQKWDVFSHLQNDGSVLVTESSTVRLNGSVSRLERRLATSTDQKLVIKRFVRMAEPEAVEIAEVNDEQGDHYFWNDGKLIWNVKPTKGETWDQEVVGFRLEYELRNALAPIWDIPAGSSSFATRSQFPQFFQRFRETLDGWRQGAKGWDRRFRFDHDVLFTSFPATGPIELNYTFKYDDAWLNRTPDAPLGRATHEVDYRVTEVRDYLLPGWPPAIELWRPALRVGSIVGFILTALLLWLVFAVGEILRKGFIGRRFDRQWFAQHVLPLAPEIIALDTKATAISPFYVFLHRMRAKGILALHEDEVREDEDDLIYRLKYVREDSDLRPFERRFLQKLFPTGRGEIDSKQFSQIHSKEGFDPDEELQNEMQDNQKATPSLARKTSRFWGLIRHLLPVLFVSSGAAILIETFRQENADFFTSAVLTSLSLLIVPILCSVFRRPVSGAISGLLALIPIVCAIPGIISFHLISTLPLGPFGSIGIALFALWTIATMLWVVRMRGGGELNSEAGIAEMARTYVRDELRRPSPALDDAWMPHLVALGCSEAVNEWRQRRANSVALPLAPGQLPSMEASRPFVGDLSGVPSKGWGYAFYVPSEVERKEWEEDEKAEKQEGGLS